MPYIKQVSKVGNSKGVILDRPILKMVGWDEGTEVEVQVQDDAVVLRKHRTATAGEFEAAKRHVLTKAPASY